MANVCDFVLRAVSKNKESLERLIKIFNFKDSEWCLAGIYESEPVREGIVKDGDFYRVDIFGSVKWSISSWFHDDDYCRFLGQHLKTYPKKENGEYDLNKPTYDAPQIFVTINKICKELETGIEIYSSSYESGFEAHDWLDCNGSEVLHDYAETPAFFDEDDEGENESETAKEHKGIENFGVWAETEKIYSLASTTHMVEGCSRL